MNKTNTKRRIHIKNFMQDSTSTLDSNDPDRNFMTNDRDLNEVILSLQKNFKSIFDMNVISKYLNSMEGLVDLAKKSSEDYKSLLSNMSHMMKYEHLGKDRVIFHLGDCGDKFFLILNGQVSVLVPRPEKIEMGEDEYVTYLAKLNLNLEYDLLNKCINLNNHIYPVDKDELIARIERMCVRIGDNLNSPSKTVAHMEIKRALAVISQRKGNSFKKFKRGSFDILINSDENYIKETSPFLYVNKARGIKRFVTAFIFSVVKTYVTGDKFGEVALQAVSGRRTATLITKTDCHFGILDKPSFDNCLNIIFERIKKDNINLIISTPIFAKVDKHTFKRQLYEYFTHLKVKSNHVLMNENEDSKMVYFLKEGEFEVKTRRNLSEVNSIVKSLGGVIIKEDREIEMAEGNFID